MSAFSRRRFLSAALAAGAVPLIGSGVGQSLFAIDPPKAKPNPIPGAINDFAWQLYDQLRGTPGNVFFSPVSIESALSMTAVGAKGDTLAEMRDTLRIPHDEAELLTGFRALGHSLNQEQVPADKRGHELSMANALWGSSAYPWRKDYLGSLRASFGAGLIETDFGDPEAARAKINAWVEHETHKKITNLIKEGMLDASYRLVLTNAVYFKGQWETRFDVKSTKPAPFHLTDGTKKDVPFMHRTGEIAYAETGDVQAVELPYKGGETSMVVILPKTPAGLAAVEKAMTAKAVDEIVGKLRPREDVRLTLPKFTLEAAYDLAPALKGLGMKQAFTPAADFTGMHSSDEELFIGFVVHKAFVAVDEEGTTAAAATGIGMKIVSAPVPVSFTADRPFLFLIRHKSTNTTLFAGKVEKP